MINRRAHVKDRVQLWGIRVIVPQTLQGEDLCKSSMLTTQELLE